MRGGRPKKSTVTWEILLKAANWGGRASDKGGGNTPTCLEEIRTGVSRNFANGMSRGGKRKLGILTAYRRRAVASEEGRNGNTKGGGKIWDKGGETISAKSGGGLGEEVPAVEPLVSREDLCGMKEKQKEICTCRGNERAELTFS